VGSSFQFHRVERCGRGFWRFGGSRGLWRLFSASLFLWPGSGTTQRFILDKGRVGCAKWVFVECGGWSAGAEEGVQVAGLIHIRRAHGGGEALITTAEG